MKVKFFAVLAALLMVGAIAIPASAQELTNDVIFIRVGYVPMSVTTFDKGIKGDYVDPTFTWGDYESTGFAVVGEYGLNLSPVLLSFGLEYQRLTSEGSFNDGSGDPDSDFSETVNQFVIPQVTVKYLTAGGFYIGAGLAAKWMVSTEGFALGAGGDKDMEWDKGIDLWLNGVIGYIFPVSEGIYIDVQGRFGYNLTGNQYSELSDTDGSYEISPSSAYDVAVYVGVGFKSFATGL
jgi:hypothetical protein